MTDIKQELGLVRAATTSAYSELEKAYTGATDSHIIGALADTLRAINRLARVVELLSEPAFLEPP